jgi:hypothetical protein
MKNLTVLSFLLLATLSGFMLVMNNFSPKKITQFPNTGTAVISNFTQTINPGTLSVDIVDSSYTTVAGPAVAMNPVTFSFVCQTSTGTFGTAIQNIYIKNPNAANNGWVVSLAAATPTASWTSAGTGMDFNDPAGAGCADGADPDTLKGQMTVDPSVSTLTVGGCSICTVANITKGSSAAFNEGTLDSVTILTGAALSNDIGDWKLTGVAISQKIPAEQPAASDYAIPLTLSIIAS